MISMSADFALSRSNRGLACGFLFRFEYHRNRKNSRTITRRIIRITKKTD